MGSCPQSYTCSKPIDTVSTEQTEVKPWVSSYEYEEGEVIRAGNKRFKCKAWPYYFWCRMSAYQGWDLSHQGAHVDALRLIRAVLPTNLATILDAISVITPILATIHPAKFDPIQPAKFDPVHSAFLSTKQSAFHFRQAKRTAVRISIRKSN